MKVRFNTTALLAAGFDVYNYRDAVNDATVHQDPYLFSQACPPSGNCSEACVNVNIAFNDTFTLQNCMALPKLSRAILNDTLEPDDAAFCQQMGITGDQGVASNVSSTLFGCVEEYWTSAARIYHDSRLRPTGPGPNPSWFHLCSKQNRNPNSTLNADVGGIGVMLSYFLQAGITLAIFVLLRLSTSWIFWPAKVLLSILSPSTKGQGVKTSHLPKVRAKQDWMQRHVFARLTHGTVGFHTEQCMFMIAVQSAALLILGHGARDLGVASVGEFYDNIYVLSGVAIGGILPPTMILVMLHMSDVRSWYMFILTAFSVAISGATHFKVRFLDADYKEIPMYAPSPLNKCQAANPIKYCVDPVLSMNGPGSSRNFNMQDPGDLGLLAFILCSVLLLLCFVDKVAEDIPRRPQSEENFDRLRERLQFHKPTRTSSELSNVHYDDESNRHFLLSRSSSSEMDEKGQAHLGSRGSRLQQGLDAVWMILEAVMLLLIVLTGYYIWILAGVRGGSFISGGEWSFGQIVAVSIWAPAVVEFFYVLLWGMQGVVKYRLPPGWSVEYHDPQVQSGEGEQRWYRKT